MRKTHTQFLEDFERLQPELFTELEFLNEYKNRRTKILVKNKYGICLVYPESLFISIPTIQIAINKNSYFHEQLLEINSDFFKENTIISDYVKLNANVHVQTKYGICSVRPWVLLRGSSPTIASAINKNEYFINQAIEVHKNTYDYSLVDYKNNINNINIICKKHGIFKQTPCTHLSGSGCNKCGHEKTKEYNSNNPQSYRDSLWIELGSKSKHFDSYKTYIIRCWNDNEEFYKIGKTYTSINKRFSNKTAMPYNWEILAFQSGIGKQTCEKERFLHNKYKNYKYKPLIKFGGMTECFKFKNIK